MPSSSEAITGRYIPKLVSDQTYNREPRYSVNVDVKELAEVPSQSTPSNLKNNLIIGGLVTLAVLAVGTGIVVPVAVSQLRTSTTTPSTSSTSSLVNNANATTGGSSSSNATTVSMSTVSTVLTSNSTTAAPGFSASGAIASGSSAWYCAEQLVIICSANLNNITIKITVQKNGNATYNGAYSTFSSGAVTQSYVDNGTQLIYTWVIVSGQIISASGGPYTVEAQFHLFGVTQVTSADTYQMTATTVGGVTSSSSGHF